MATITTEFCFALNGKGGGDKLDLEAVDIFKEKNLWIHIDYKDQENQEWLEEIGLDETVIENLLDEDTSPRYFQQDGGLLVVMRGVNTHKKDDVDDMIAIHMWIDKDRILTLSHRALPAVRQVSALIRKGEGPVSPIDCFLMLAESLTESIEKTTDKIDDEVDELEEEVIAAYDHRSDKRLRSEIADLRHKIVGLRRYLVPQRNTIKVMKNIDHPLLNEDDRDRLRNIYMDLAKAVEDLDFARDHSTVTQEELDSKTNINISQTMYMMSIVMVIFTPLTFLTGLLGANIGGIPFGEDNNGFTFISLILVGIVIFQIAVFKKMRWF